MEKLLCRVYVYKSAYTYTWNLIQSIMWIGAFRNSVT